MLEQSERTAEGEGCAAGSTVAPACREDSQFQCLARANFSLIAARRLRFDAPTRMTGFPGGTEPRAQRLG